MRIKLLLIFSSLMILTSCSSLIEGMYKDLDKQSRADVDEDPDAYPDQFDQYRKNTKRRTSSVYNKPGRNRGEVTTSTEKNVSPEVKRQYKEERVALKRVTASDLTDNGNDGSLWGGSDPNAFLFSTSKNKTSGDIVQINVLAKLRNEITLELKRAFPKNPYELKGKDGEKKSEAPAPAPTPAAEASASNETDRISGVVVEEINREHLLIKGRKNVLFENKKRMVEVQALVSRKDISDNDTVNSDAIIESSVSVVR